MTDDALASCRLLVTSVLRDSRAQTAHNGCIAATTKECCGEKACDNKFSYIKETKKLEDMSMNQFLKRLDSMSAVLVILKRGGTSFTVEELNTQVTSKALT